VSSTHSSKSVHFTLSVVIAAIVLMVAPLAVAQTPARPARPGSPTTGRPSTGRPPSARPDRTGAGGSGARGGAARGAATRGGGVYAGTARGSFEPYRDEPIDWKEIPDKGKRLVMLDAPTMPVREFLQTISITMGWTVVMDEGVAEKQIHAYFQKISVRDALKVLQFADLYYEYDKESNVLTVTLEDEYYMDKYGDIELFEYDVQHVDVIDMQSTIETMMSPQGRIIADSRLSRLIVFDTKHNLEYIKKLLKALDVEIKPVIIPLQYVSAFDVSSEIEGLLTLQGEVLANSRTNKLIVSDIPEGINRVRAYVEAVDVEVVTRTFELKYALFGDVQTMLNVVIPSDMGIIQVDQRMRQITVTTTPQKMKETEEIIAMLDKRIRQVHIKAYILRVNSNLVRDIGIQWRQLGKMPDGKPLTISVAPPISGTSAVEIGSDEYDFSAIINLLLTDSDTEVLSEPEISVIDGLSATFRVQTEVPYQSGSTTVSTAVNPVTSTQVSFKNVGVMLQVKPLISVTGDIQLDLTIEDSNFTLRPIGDRDVPEVTVSSATSSMLVSDGSTVILGGLRGGTREDSVDKVPILGDIPLVGRVFRTTNATDRFQELLIFITPTVTALETSTRVTELEQAREDLQKKVQETRDWPFGKIKNTELPPLPPVSRREDTVEDSSTKNEGEQP